MTRRRIISPVPAGTGSPSLKRTWRTERRWRRVRAARSLSKSSTTRTCLCREKSSKLRLLQRPDWRWLSPDTHTHAHTHTTSGDDALSRCYLCRDTLN